MAQVFLRAGVDPGQGPEQRKQQEQEQPSRPRPAVSPGRGRHPARPAGTAPRQEEVRAKGSVAPGVRGGASVRPRPASADSLHHAGRGDRDGQAAVTPQLPGSKNLHTPPTASAAQLLWPRLLARTAFHWPDVNLGVMTFPAG